MIEVNRAPGQPGSPAIWAASRKDGAGAACNLANRVWFTLSEGIFTEIFYPRIDCACVRDMQLVVTDGESFFSEEKRNTNSSIHWMESGVPAFHVVNVEHEGRYRIEKFILNDPNRPVVLQKTRFVPQQGSISTFHIYALLAPHLANEGNKNTGWVGEYKGITMLMAEYNGVALALACSAPFLASSVGFVGVSDGWQDLSAHKKLTSSYNLAEKGNIALTGEIDLALSEGEFVLAIGFGRTAHEAAHHARASLIHGFDACWQQFRNEWQDWHETLMPLDTIEENRRNPYRISTTMLRCHESTDFPGSTVASLSIPWGYTAKGTPNTGGYHLVWPRDVFHASTALIAAGAYDDAVRVLEYLEATQEADGHWPKTMWLDGTAYQRGIELDEIAAPLILIEVARRERMLSEGQIMRLWPMVHKAAGYILRNGPATRQDRWEEQSGYSPYTLAVTIAGLLCAADILDEFEPELALYLRQTADSWNASIEDWTYVTDTNLAREHSLAGYYMRIAPHEVQTGRPIKNAAIQLKYIEGGPKHIIASEQVSPDALALVRFGLRAPDDPRILNTLQIIDALLKTETPLGPCWHRFNGDGYGEKSDGSPFDQSGIGRLWPLLTGERAHYELAAGNYREARRLLAALERFGGRTGLLSEQIWDSQDIPAMNLFAGRATGSARPLVWAHSEHVKLLRSLRDQAIFDMPPQTVQRYLIDNTPSEYATWRLNMIRDTIPIGQTLRIETYEPVQVHWSSDNWLSVQDQKSCDTGLGIHITDLPTEHLSQDSRVAFTLFWTEKDRWEGKDFGVQIGPEPESVEERIAEKRSIRRPRFVGRTTIVRRVTRVTVRPEEPASAAEPPERSGES